MDRGLFSVETISLLTCLKLRYPDRVQLIRGNHESRAVTQVSYHQLTRLSSLMPPKTYGFYTECVRKYGTSHVWTYFTDMFDFLTLSVVIDDRIFCVHGGKLQTLLSTRWNDLWQGSHPRSTQLIKSKLLIDLEVCFTRSDVFVSHILTITPEIPHEGPMADLVWSDPDPEKEDFAISPRYDAPVCPFSVLGL